MLIPRLHAILGSLVVTVGFWLTWGELPLVAAIAVALGLVGFLTWRSSTIGTVWAWVTLLLGLESATWPFVTMVQVRLVTAEPTDEQMGAILHAVIWGLPAGIFWMSFSYGLFKRIGQRGEGTGAAG